MPLDAVQQSRSNKKTQNFNPQYDKAHYPYQVLMLHNPAGDSPQTTAQEDDALCRKLIQHLGSDPTLRVPHCAVLQRVHTACRRDAAG